MPKKPPTKVIEEEKEEEEEEYEEEEEDYNNEQEGEDEEDEEDEDEDEEDGPVHDGKWMGEDGDSDDEDGHQKETMVLNPTNVRERIDHALEILSDFKARTDKSQSRVDIVSTLSHDLSEYYGYINELSDFLLDLFSPSECVEYMDASDRPRPMVIRANTLKSTRKDLMEALSKRGCMLEAVDWSKVAIKVTESTVPIGATPEYLAGHYMLQSAASLNPGRFSLILSQSASYIHLLFSNILSHIPLILTCCLSLCISNH